MLLYNTATRSKEVFKPKSDNNVRVYACGPTPYNFAHIGNLKAYVTEDVILRAIRFLGYRTTVVMNITDIDDKTIRDSRKSGESLYDFTERYTRAFLEDTDRLGIERWDHIVRISETVPEMGKIIQKLLDTGHAYLADDGSVYYRIRSFPRYGEFAHLDMSGLADGVRISNDEYEKESVADFALWKAYDPEADGPNKWDLEFVVDGTARVVPGRPGWHIECSAVNEKYFGSELDLHFGGIDHIFPHHQNEIAQTEAYTGKQFSRCWSHGSHLLVDNKKMAKSANNFYTLRDVLARMSDLPEALVCRAFRLMILETRYRENFNFTFDRLSAAVAVVRGFDELVRRLGAYVSDRAGTRPDFRDFLQESMGAFVDALEDDVSTPEALALAHSVAAYLNREMDAGTLGRDERLAAVEFLRSMDSVFGTFDFSRLEAAEVPESLLALARERDMARAAKDYARSDAIRAEIEAAGWRVVDDRSGTRVEPK